MATEDYRDSELPSFAEISRRKSVRTFSERVLDGIDLEQTIRILETSGFHVRADGLKVLRDRLKRGPIVASDLDIEQFLAVDMLIAIRKLFGVRPEQALLPELERIVGKIDQLHTQAKPLLVRPSPIGLNCVWCQRRIMEGEWADFYDGQAMHGTCHGEARDRRADTPG